MLFNFDGDADALLDAFYEHLHSESGDELAIFQLSTGNGAWRLDRKRRGESRSQQLQDFLEADEKTGEEPNDSEPE